MLTDGRTEDMNWIVTLASSSKSSKIVVVTANIMTVIISTEFEDSYLLLYFTTNVSKLILSLLVTSFEEEKLT